MRHADYLELAWKRDSSRAAVEYQPGVERGKHAFTPFPTPDFDYVRAMIEPHAGDLEAMADAAALALHDLMTEEQQ